ncbi:hypothetical protein SIO57_000732 [Klebsiella pneumoniae]|nr:hypothetical protein [Klebsiella pneumoniae]
MMKINKSLVIAGAVAFLIGVAPYGVGLYIHGEATDCISIAQEQGNGMNWSRYMSFLNTPRFPKISFPEGEKTQAYKDTPQSERPAVISDYFSQAAGSYAYWSNLWEQLGVIVMCAGGVIAALGVAMEASRRIFKGWLYVVRETANAVRGKE